MSCTYLIIKMFRKYMALIGQPNHIAWGLSPWKNSIAKIFSLFVSKSIINQSLSVNERLWIHFQLCFFFHLSSFKHTCPIGFESRHFDMAVNLTLFLQVHRKNVREESTLQNIYTLSVLLYAFKISRHNIAFEI